MDMNDVIISLGGVSQITAALPIDATDEQIASHLANNVIGDNVPTLAQVKAQKPIYIAQVEASLQRGSIPSVVSMRQARLALLQFNLLATVDTAIASGSEADKIAWEYATEVRREDALVTNLSTVLGLTSQQLDSLFTLAATL